MTYGSIMIAHPDGRQQTIALRAGTLRIGSAPDNDLVLAGAGIAGRHATFRCDNDGDLLITIAGSEPCSVAAMEIELPRAFATAMLLRIGGYMLRYQPPARPSYMALQAASLDDQATFLHALLDRRIVWAEPQPRQTEAHEAITMEMQALRGVEMGE
jgi:hypothetical protein